MDTKTVYQTDHMGLYIGAALADPSPLEVGVWLLPAGCVEVAPPQIPEHKAAHWDGEKWQLIDCYQGLTAYNTETAEAIEVQRLGPLPTGYTLEVPGPNQVWRFGRWEDDIPAVIVKRYGEKVAAVNAACAAEIIGGFWSTALEARHFYESELEDQVNLAGMIMQGSDSLYSCRDESNIKAFREHTAEQLRQVGNEFTAFKLQRLQRALDLKRQLEEAMARKDLDSINAISWTASA